MVGAFLHLAACLYRGVVQARAALYDFGVVRPYRSRLPVISIGNVTAGGNGKTPLCLYVASECALRGLRPAILSRGYGGLEKGPYRVEASDSPRRVGDEPLLMAQSGIAPVYISRARARGARLIEAHGLADVIILDDGFQHRGLARDVDIVSVFAGNPEAVEDFIEGKLLPEGRFREPRDRALRRASLIVVSERSVLPEGGALPPIDERLLKALPRGVAVYRAYFEASSAVSLESGQPIPRGPVHAFAAIANPEGFYDSLARLGYTLLSKTSFPDHHEFSRRDVEGLLAKASGLPLVCTSKDAVKLRAMGASCVSGCGVLDVRVKVVPTDAFMVHIQRRLVNAKPE